MAERPICEAFVVVAELARASGALAPLTRYPGCWEYEVDERWRVALNAHPVPKEASFSNGVPVEPFHCFVTYNGWPAFIFNPYGGVGAAGSAANENTFIAAVRDAIAKVQP